MHIKSNTGHSKKKYDLVRAREPYQEERDRYQEERRFIKKAFQEKDIRDISYANDSI